ncbi:hypothetical protein GGR53DRAFT_516849 [Hypoxylon sp. FL1150]|nr:hypothetical protein GGR53DRAFT_516849 [Hypoxylon sp. FL1150]
MPNDYVPISQEGSDIKEKDAILFVPVQQTRTSVRWRQGVFILATLLIGSVCVNMSTSFSFTDSSSSLGTYQKAFIS